MNYAYPATLILLTSVFNPLISSEAAPKRSADYPLVAQVDAPTLEEATQLNNQSLEYYQQGLYSEAARLLSRALQIRELILGDTHPTVAHSLNNLAWAYQMQGDYATAEPLHQRALQIRETVLGETHPDVAYSLNSLGMLYYHQSQYTEAEPLLLRAVQIRENFVGDRRSELATSINHLAVLYQAQGRYNEAEILRQQVAHVQEQIRTENADANQLPQLQSKTSLGRSHPRLITP